MLAIFFDSNSRLEPINNLTYTTDLNYFVRVRDLSDLTY